MAKLFGKKQAARPFVSAIVAAGGGSTRMSGENKLLCAVCGLPVLLHSLSAFESCECIDEIILVARSEFIVEYTNLASGHGISKLVHVVNGGATRLESVYRGMAHISADAAYVAVHDAARPCVTPGDISAVCAAAVEHGCALAAAPVTDTIKRVEDGRVTGTEDRLRLCRAQTPQVADKAMLYAALKKAMETSPPATDESMALERMGFRPHIVQCSDENIKITTPGDLILAEMILARR